MMKGVLASLFSVLVLWSVSSLAVSSNPSAGKVIVSTGLFQAIKPDNSIIVLTRGNDFYTGDALATGKNSTAQIRFTDGTMMALNANSRIKINDYQFDKKVSSDKSIVTLVTGGFRALTGLISKENPSAYQVQTSVAVIGVRGTNYGAVLANGKLYTGVWKGGISIKNDKGHILLGTDQDYNFSETSLNEAPIGLLNAPSQLGGECQIDKDSHT